MPTIPSFLEVLCSANSPQNRRRSHRTPFGLKAMMHLGNETPLPGVRIKDISREGMRLFSWEPIQPGRTVRIAIPDLDRSENFTATVRRCHQTCAGRFDIGVCFATDEIRQYKPAYDDLWEIECYRQTIEQFGGQPINTVFALTQWRRKFAGRRYGRSI